MSTTAPPRPSGAVAAGKALGVPSTMDVAFISHSDCGLHDTGWEHPEHVGRLRAIPSALKYHPELFGALRHHEGRHATAQELSLAHTPAYIERVRLLAEAGGGRLDQETVVSSGSWLAATAAAGCVLDAVDMVMDGTVAHAFCAVRPPGHHAVRDRGMGFCLFGNVGVAAHYARQHHGLERVLVIDWDVHHGNGTQALVEDDAGIRFVSMHQWPWYPGTGAADDRGPLGNIYNVSMAAELAPAVYTDALWNAVDAATHNWTPQLVLLSAGFDCLASDPLGGFTWTLTDIAQLTRELIARCQDWCDGRLVSALEGGYAPEATAEACIVHMKEMVAA